MTNFYHMILYISLCAVLEIRMSACFKLMMISTFKRLSSVGPGSRSIFKRQLWQSPESSALYKSLHQTTTNTKVRRKQVLQSVFLAACKQQTDCRSYLGSQQCPWEEVCFAKRTVVTLKLGVSFHPLWHPYRPTIEGAWTPDTHSPRSAS